MSDAPIRVVFIAGSGRSGSTLLEQLLAQVDGFAACGEVRHLFLRGLGEDQLCSCGKPFSGCPFWSKVAGLAFPDDLDLDALLEMKERVDRMRFIPAMLSPLQSKSFARDHRAYLAVIERLYRSIQQVAGEDRVIIDSSKDLSTLYLLRQLPSVEVSILHLVRDPRGVAYSWMKSDFKRPEITDREEFMPVYDYRKTAIEWVARNLLAEAAAGDDCRLVRIRYEDLVDDPRSAVEKVVTTVLGSAPNLDAFDDSVIEVRDCTHQVAGNPSRFRYGKLELALDESWREKLPASRRRLVSLLTAPLLTRYGYFRALGRSSK